MKRTTIITVAMALMLILTMTATTALAATFRIDTTIPAGQSQDICYLVKIPGGQEIDWNLSFDHAASGGIAVSQGGGGVAHRQEFDGMGVQGGFTPSAYEADYHIYLNNTSGEALHVTGTVELPYY